MYLQAYAELGDRDTVPADLLQKEYEVRRQFGAPARLSEFARRFPAQAGALGRLVEQGPPLLPGATPRTAPPAPPSGSPTVIGDVAPRAPAATPALPAVPGYELLGELGRGGMGVVYKARQLGLNRTVALKMILDAAHAGPEALARFRREAEAVAQLQHPNIVQVHEVGEADGRPFFSMEYVEGGLAQQLDGTPQPVRPAAELVATLARAVHAAHQCGVVHRDLKPANVLLLASGGRQPPGHSETPGGLHPPLADCIPKVTDFGLAKRLDQEKGQTHTGSILGTPCYMAPEQAEGRTRDVGPLSDVWALGAILYELLTGRPPFLGATVLDTLEQVRSQEPVPPTYLQPKVPRDLETVCLKCLHKEPARRYPTAQALADDLQRFLGGEPIRARPTPLWERAAKWARRRPAVAALAVLSALLAVVGVSGVTWEWLRAETEWGRAEQARRDEEDQRKNAEEETRKTAAERDRAELNLYYQLVIAAQRDWSADDVAAARKALDLCPPRLRQWEWHYVQRLCHAEFLTLGGHSGAVTRAAFSPDGTRLASAGGDGTVKVWDAASGREVLTFRGHTNSVVSVAFSPDGKRVASAGGDFFVRVWEAATGREVLTLKGHKRDVWGLAFSPDGRRLASASADRAVKVWDAVTGQELAMLGENRPLNTDDKVGHTDIVTSVAFHPRRPLLASGGADRTVRLWDLDGRKLLHTWTEHTNDVRGVAFSPDGWRLASAGRDQTVRLWDPDTRRQVATLTGHAGGTNHVAYSPDGRRLATAGEDRTVKVWDAAAGQELFTLRGHTAPVAGVAFRGDGQRLASAGRDGAVKVWDATTGPEVRRLRGASEWTFGVAFSPDGRRLAVAGRGREGGLAQGQLKVWGEIKVLDLATGKTALSLDGHTDQVNGVAFSPDGGRLASASRDGTVRLWDAATGKPLFTCKGHGNMGTGAVFHPDGRRLASAGGTWDKEKRLWTEGGIRIWEADGGQEVLRLTGHTGLVVGVAFSPDGTRLASAGDDGTVRVWDAATGHLQLTRAHGSNGVGFSPDGRLVASAGRDGTVRVWDVEGREVQALRGHAGPVLRVAFSPDGQRLASAGADGTVKLWDVASGQAALTLRGHAQAVTCLAFHPRARQLASAGMDDRVHLWDATPPPEEDGAKVGPRE